MTTIHGACPAAAKFEIVDGLALDNVSTFLAPDCVPNNSCHTHFLSNTTLCVLICKMLCRLAEHSIHHSYTAKAYFNT